MLLTSFDYLLPHLCHCFSFKLTMATKHSCRESGKVLKFWMLWILGFLRLTLAITTNVSDHDLEIMNLLKKLNKPYVKSIKSPDGDIIDCVPFHLQPAFDNPLLKNYSIQTQPSSYPKGFFGNQSSNTKPLTQLWHTNGRCPEGTIPIRRTTKEDILRAKSIQSYGKKTPQTIPNPDSPPAGQTNNPAREYAIRRARRGRFHGTKVEIGVWNPSIQDDEFSLAQTWVLAGSEGVDLNSIEVGWQVYRDLYADDRTRLFGYWTRDAYRDTGCYNLDCEGFVQHSNALSLGAVISPTSAYGVVQHEISLFIYKDPISGHWWLEVGGEPIGFWPTNLFTHLRNFATGVDWGGEVVNRATNGRHTTTQMGSGRFSIEDYTKAASFTHIQILDQSYSLLSPVGLQTYVTNPRCYDLRSRKSERLGEFFYYGGPGRNPNCP